jgi:oxygen-independent coproporphyrinogen-3 oxidase
MNNFTNSLPGLYLHVPLCRSKCSYCDFYSITDLSLVSAWLAALQKEVLIYQGSFAPFDSLYLGGGTPSLLDGRQLTALMACLRRHFTFAPEAEVTLEANPDDLTLNKLTVLKDLGVNRLSLGVQSFDDQELAFLGRRHTARQAEQALNWSRAAGFTNLGLDLIYGLPGQKTEAWLKNLERALKFRPEHLSCYQLTLEAGTPLGARKVRGQIKPLPEETERDLFLLTSRFLTEQGYSHYEISNFARGETYYSRHNRKYWRHVPYLGLGPAAHSFTEGKRWWNHRSLEQYCRALREGGAPVAGSETLSAAQRHLESLYLGLRTKEGVALDLIRRQPRGDQMLGELQKAGLVKVRHGRAAPTREGFLVADRLPLWFAD